MLGGGKVASAPTGTEKPNHSTAGALGAPHHSSASRHHANKTSAPPLLLFAIKMQHCVPRNCHTETSGLSQLLKVTLGRVSWAQGSRRRMRRSLGPCLPAHSCPLPTALHQKVTTTFLPTAIKFHYLFNLRDLSNIFQVAGGLFSLQHPYSCLSIHHVPGKYHDLFPKPTFKPALRAVKPPSRTEGLVCLPGSAVLHP